MKLKVTKNYNFVNITNKSIKLQNIPDDWVTAANDDEDEEELATAPIPPPLLEASLSWLAILGYWKIDILMNRKFKNMVELFFTKTLNIM